MLEKLKDNSTKIDFLNNQSEQLLEKEINDKIEKVRNKVILLVN
jgi:hypothetical protein